MGSVGICGAFNEMWAVLVYVGALMRRRLCRYMRGF